MSLIQAERLPIKTYTVADGLLRDEISKIKQDSRGFLWFCTAEGISRFDGVGMTNFTVADGLPNRFVEDFLETKSGTIYIATDKGLARLNPHGIRASTENPLFTVFAPDNPKAEKILTLYEAANNRVWVGTSGGLYKLIETDGQIRFEFVPLGESPELGAVEADTPYIIKVILEDRRGTLWLGTETGGLLRLTREGNMRRFNVADGLGSDIADLLEDRAGRLWASMSNGGGNGLCLLDAEASENPVVKCYSKKDGLPVNWIPDLLETGDGKFWLATVAGLCLWQGEGKASVCKTYTAKNDLCDGVSSLLEDKDGNLWTGSPCGAKKIARYGFTTYAETDGLDNAYANSIFENTAGELFVSTNVNGRDISRFDADKFSLVKPPLPKLNYYGWGWQQTVWQDRAGAWWIPVNAGVFRSPDNTSFENLARASLEPVKIGTKGNEVFRLFEDSRGDIWIAVLTNELWRWERAANTWHDYTAQIGLSPERLISAFVEDRSGNVWIGTGSDDPKQYYESRLIRCRDGQFRVFTEAEGAPRGWARDLFLDSHGRLWIASTQDGLLRLDDTNADRLDFVRYTPANGLTSNVTTSVTEDAFGRIYVGTWRGIDRLNPDTGQIENFTTADGLPASLAEISYRDRRNNLWFGTHQGLARFVPEPPRTREPPIVLITGLRVEGEMQAVSILGETSIPELDLNSEQQQITVDFLGLGATLGEHVKYEYRFGEAAWTATAERTVNFANLASGEYRFEVRAQTADGIYSRQPALVSFKIAAPIWQRWWFIAALLILIAPVIYGFYRFRLARLLEVANMRTRIATDLHDDIGANLTKIAILSEVAQQQLGHKFGASGADGKDNLLGSVAEISRESVSAMGDIVWAINPKKDSLIGLTRRMRQYGEEILERSDINLEFNAPAPAPDLKLDANIRRNIYLIFKESVNNIVRHSNAAAVAIDFALVDKELVLQIGDDGIGFDRTREYDGNGLLNIKKRAEDCGGRLEIVSVEGAGTKIVLRLKLKSAAWSWR